MSGIYQGWSDINNGGDFRVGRYTVGGGVDVKVSDTLEAEGLAVYRRSNYDFSGSSGFGGLDPWDDVDHIRLTVAARLRLDEEWTAHAGPFLDYSGESGVKFSKARSWGGVADVIYSPWTNLNLGLGVVVMTRSEESVSFYPIVLFDWRFARDWTLRNGSFPLGPNGAAGVEIAWDFAPGWEGSVASQYQTRSFRLDEQGPEPTGFGNETSVPLFATITCGRLEGWRLSVFGGAVLGARLELEGSGGHRVSRETYAPAPLAGLKVALDF